MSPEECGVIFDVDGVLVDTHAFHFQAFLALGEEAGYTISEEQFRHVFGWHNTDIFPYLYGHPLPLDRLAWLSNRKEQIYREAVRDNVAPLPGVTELLPNLKAVGFHLAIGTSTARANVHLIITSLGFQDLFEAVITGEDVAKGKPDPQVFLLAAQRLGIPPERSMVVEDAVAGVQAALNAGMKALAVTTNHPRSALSHAHLVVDSLAEVSPHDLLALLT